LAPIATRQCHSGGRTPALRTNEISRPVS
jgi:hypothetical protein